MATAGSSNGSGRLIKVVTSAVSRGAGVRDSAGAVVGKATPQCEVGPAGHAAGMGQRGVMGVGKAEPGEETGLQKRNQVELGLTEWE